MLKERKTFGSRLARVTKAIQTPLMFVLVFLLALGGYFRNRGLQYSAVLAVGLMTVRLLTEIHRLLARGPRYKETFNNLREAKAAFMRRARMKGKKDEITLRYVGMTMFNAWGVMEEWLDDLSTLGYDNIDLRVAMLDSEWLEREQIRDTWTGQSAEEMARKIMARHGKGCRVTLHRYAHMPCLHGCLINDRYLLYGIARWEVDGMHAGDRPFELLADGADATATASVEAFRSWFDQCTAEPGHRKYTLPALTLNSPNGQVQGSTQAKATESKPAAMPQVSGQGED